jgi:hypothetical protein
MKLTAEQLAAQAKYQAASLALCEAANAYLASLQPSVTPVMMGEAQECVSDTVFELGAADSMGDWYNGLLADQLAEFEVE